MKKKKTNQKKREKRSNTVTVGPKYQVVIPRDVRRQCTGFNKGAKVEVLRLDDSTVMLKAADENWAETQYGALKDVWKDIDPINELKKMRDEWDD